MVSLKGSYVVKPAEQTPSGRMLLSDCDQVKAVTHAPTVYFYRSTAQSLAPPIDILRDSLSKALVMFYPLAGRLRCIGGGRLELDCNSMGVLLVEAQSDAKVDDFGDFCPSPATIALIPSVDYDQPIHEQPLLVAQLTKFSCGGACVGLGISHVIVDGQSALHFVAEWSRVARGEQPSHPPFLDRTLLLTENPHPRFDHLGFSPPPLLIGHSDNTEERKKETTVALLKLSKEQIDKLKNKGNDGLTGNNRRGGVYSRYETVAAHIWRCACKARELKGEQQTRLYIAVDFRRRMEPPLPPYYFGNAVFREAAAATSGELVSRPLGYASDRIREAKEKVTDGYVRSSLAFVRRQGDASVYRNFHSVGCHQGAFYGNPNIEITTWSALPLYGTDFGWGKEIHMGPGGIGFDGKCFILPSHEEEGSFNLHIRLQVPHMASFKRYLYDDI